MSMRANCLDCGCDEFGLLFLDCRGWEAELNFDD